MQGMSLQVTSNDPMRLTSIQIDTSMFKKYIIYTSINMIKYSNKHMYIRV